MRRGNRSPTGLRRRTSGSRHVIATVQAGSSKRKVGTGSGEEELRPPTAQCAKMDDPQLFDELLRAAEKLGVEVRVEPFETPAVTAGGLCVVRGERLVLIDQRAPLGER